jgi:AraC-like DNA-binding protein
MTKPPKSYPYVYRPRFKHPDEKLLSLDGRLLSELAKHPILKDLLPVTVGQFIETKGHYIERLQGYGTHQLMFCLSGSGVVQIEGDSHAVKAGDLVFFHAACYQKYFTHDADPWSTYFVHFVGKGVGNFLKWFGDVKAQPVRHLQTFREIQQAKASYEKMLGLFLNGRSDAVLFETSVEIRKLFSLYQAASYEALVGQNKSSLWQEKLAPLFEKKIKQNLSLTEMAAAANCSVSYFSSQFRKETGFSPVEYFTRLKIQGTEKMLWNNPQASISEVARAFGFEDPLYFSRVFRKIKGCSPKQFVGERKIGKS